MLAGAIAFEMSDIQEDESEAALARRSDVTMLHRVENGWMEFSRSTSSREGQAHRRPPRTQLSMETRTAIAGCYANEKTSLRALAKKFGTSLGTVQRCIGLRQSAASEGHYPFNC
jgi:hypothetical protein